VRRWLLVATLVGLCSAGLVGGGAAPSWATSSGGLGGLDQSFGNTEQPGIGAIAIGGSLASSIAIDPADSNAIAIAGDSPNGSQGYDMAVGMLTSSGAEQSQSVFSVDGQSTAATATTLATDGDIVLAGWAGVSPQTPVIAALTPSGSNLDPDGSFGSSGAVQLGALAATAGYDGGEFTAVVACSATYASNWPALCPSASDLYAVGTVSVFNQPEILVARFGATGLDTTFGAGAGYVLLAFPAFGTPPTPGADGSTVTALQIDAASGDLVIAGASDIVKLSCSQGSYDEAFLAGYTVSGGAVAPDSSFVSGGGSDLPVANGTNCGNSQFDAVAIDQASGDSGDLIASGSEFGPGVTPGGATSSAVGLLALFSLAAHTSDGFSTATGFGTSGTLTTGGTGGINELNSVAVLPSTTEGASILTAGQEYSSVLGAFSIAVQHYSFAGTLDPNFGSSGTTLLQCGNPGIDGCGSVLAVQASGGIEVGGGLQGVSSSVTSGLGVAQLTDRSVSVGAPGSNIEDSSGSAAPAVFTVTVSSPNDPLLAGLPSGLPVDFDTVNGTGKSPNNYTAESGEITFPCSSFTQPSIVSCVQGNELEATVAVPTAYPANATGSATFSLSLSDAVGASIDTSSALATIDYPAQTAPPPTTSSTSTTSTTVVVQHVTTTTTTTTIPKKKTTKKHKKSKPVAPGYWLVSSSGTVFAYGAAKSHGSEPAKKLSGTIVAMAATSDGYWLASSTGAVYAFGNAHNYGSVSKKTLNGKIVAMAVSAASKGYWLVSSTGWVYPFGNAGNFGSVAASQLNGKIVAIAASGSDKGYWLVSSTGVIYVFGSDAYNYGSAPKQHSGNVVAMVAAASGRGYWFLTSTGQVYNFGDAHPYGSITAKQKLAGSAVAIVAAPGFGGYWIASTSGGIYPFGAAKSYGSVASKKGTTIVGAAST
jgi:hypothetical protein